MEKIETAAAAAALMLLIGKQEKTFRAKNN